MMGSRILSRSFHVLRWKAEGEEPDEEAEVDEADAGSVINGESNAMDVDGAEETAAEAVPEAANQPEEPAEGQDDDDDDDDRYEDPADVAMVPMADMLNGRFNTETVHTRSLSCFFALTSSQARLFYDEEKVLKMMTVQPIKAGEQIVCPLISVSLHLAGD